MKMNSTKKTLIVLAVWMAASLPIMASAGQSNSTMDKLHYFAQYSGFAQQANPEDTLPAVISVIIQAFFAVLGAIFLFLILLGGYYYMTARGEEQKVEKALDTIRRGVVGLIIIVGSYAIWNFIQFYIINGGQ